MYSKWCKVDLHIHSDTSHDCTSELNYKILKDKLFDANGVNLFSITDHNRINVKLYEELFDKCKDNDFNFVVGCEINMILDEYLEEDDYFHALVFFNVEKSELGLLNDFLTNHIDDDNSGKIRLSQFINEFSKLDDINDKELIIIPHYNKSHRCVDKRLVGGLLQSLTFNAIEYSNNVQKLCKSLSYFLKEGYDSLPIVAFSDNHTIDNYPNGKNSNCELDMYILGTPVNAFLSLKLAFCDAEMRMTFKDKTSEEFLKNVRVFDLCGEFVLKNVSYETNNVKNELRFSPYLNTIIGNFGSGKSLLKTFILKQKDNLEVGREYYKEIYPENVTVNDSYNSLESYINNNNKTIFMIDQFKYYYNNSIDYSTIQDICNLLNIKFEHSDNRSNAKLKEKFDSFTLAFDSLKSTIKESKSTITDEFSYQHLARSNENYQIEALSSAISSEGDNNIKNNDFKFSILSDGLEKEKNRIVRYQEFAKHLSFYDTNQKDSISNTQKLILSSNKKWENIFFVYNDFVKTLDSEVENYNSRHQKIRDNIIISDSIKKNVISVFSELISFKREHRLLLLNVEEYESNLQKESIIETHLQEIRIHKSLSTDFSKLSFKNKLCREGETSISPFTSNILDSKKFKNNREFCEVVNDYLDKASQVNQKYDISYNGKLFTERSPGGRAFMLIDMLFFMISKFNVKDTLIIIDQPEDNMDNINIYNHIVRKMRELKISNMLPTSFIITHNANICVTADSECVIIAENDGNHITYTQSVLENRDNISKICEILDGGEEAFKKRGLKMNIPIMKELKND